MEISSRSDTTQRRMDHLIAVAQVLVGTVALLGIAAWLTLNPILLLLFLFSEPVLLVGFVLFMVAVWGATTQEARSSARPTFERAS